MYIRNRTLVARQGDIYIFRLLKQCGHAPDHHTKVFSGHNEEASLPPDPDLAVKAFLEAFLPGIPARKIQCVTDYDGILRVLIRLPGFAVQADQDKFMEALSPDLSVLCGIQGYIRTVPDQACRRCTCAFSTGIWSLQSEQPVCRIYRS